MKYQSLRALVADAQSGRFTGTVFIGNDRMWAEQDGEAVYNFKEAGPKTVLYDALELLGLNAEPC